jgi:cobalt transporter subunit CbtA
MLKSLFASALFAGVAAGLLAAVMQMALLVPLIAEAELYETGEKTHFGEVGPAHDHAAGDHDHAAADHDRDAEGDVLRHIQTVLFTVLAMCGFGLLLTAGFGVAERFGLDRITLAKGAIWGLAGFAAFQLLPGLGLAPELPGASSAPLEERQAWWLATVAASAAGIALGIYGGMMWKLAGLALIVAPHLLGAPHPEQFFGRVPPELSALFATRSLGVGAASWLTLGAVAGLFWSRRDATQ